MSIVQFKQLRLYEAEVFRAQTEVGVFIASGTLCGHIDFVIPGSCTIVLSPDEALAITIMLQSAREDVLKNSDPSHDPRIIETKP